LLTANPAEDTSMDPPALTPLVLVVDDQEWTSRSIESILRPKGHVVLKAYTGRQALDLVQKVSPDAIIVDFHLPDLDGIDVVREIRRAPTVYPVTPLLMMSASAVGRAERLEALGVGAWGFLHHPLDPGELVLRMETLIRAKQEADRIRDEGLTDPGTGFYNARGLLRRAQEISADAVRFERPLACIAFGPEWLDPTAAVADDVVASDDRLAEGVAEALKSATRVSGFPTPWDVSLRASSSSWLPARAGKVPFVWRIVSSAWFGSRGAHPRRPRGLPPRTSLFGQGSSPLSPASR